MNIFRHHPCPALLLLALILASSCPALQAQEVFIRVRQSSQRAAQAPGNGYVQREVARFQLEALDFLESEGVKNVQEQILTDFLDTQAYFLSRFVSTFCEDVLTRRRITPEKAEERVRIFQISSEEHPLFFSVEAPNAEEFLLDADSFTPFSLNTDWKAAFESLRK
ncbi:MAG: hypothetical protein IJ692_05220 [Alloprevotella sp.]|nr:hypothetical protein [Alloprevotella sp.]MBR1652774.1 hypothetical protein [Alloprevotella sp.]